MQKRKYTKTYREYEQEQVLTENQWGVLRINEYFSPAQQGKFS